MSELKGKVAVVTGASKGIGAGIAKELAAAGAAVVVNYVSSKAGAERVGDEGRARHHDPCARGGARAEKHPRQLGESGLRPHRGLRSHRVGRRERRREADGRTHGARPPRPAGRHRAHRGVPRLGPVRLADRRAHRGVGRVCMMKFGLFGINMGPCSDPVTAVRVAQAAEAAGFESVWTGEHIVLPDADPQVPASPVPPGIGHGSRRRLAQHLDPKSPLLDPAVSLAFVAAHTKTIKLGTGIIILPQRNPLVLAKELASVDVVSGGRLIFGLGIGYLKPEFDALGIPFDHKGPRSIEYLQAMQAVWTQEKPAYQGRFVSFSGIQALPQPVQKPYPPVVIGGHTPEAFRRAVQYGNGWYGFALDLDATAKCLAGLKAAAQAVSRPNSLGELEISITPGPGLDPDMAKRYAELGVQRLIPFRRAKTEGELLDFVSQ